MTPAKRNEFLIDLYKFQVEENHAKGGQITRSSITDEEYREQLTIANYWEEKGVITKNLAAGFILIKLTSYGIDYVEGTLK